MRITGKLAAAVLSGLCVVSVASCSSDPQGASSSQAQQSPAQQLAAAKTKVDAAPSVHLKLASANVPQGASGVVSADGWGKHPPAFKGTFKVTLKGVQADAEITSIGGEVYAKLPLIPGTNKIDPADFGLPDPADLFSPDQGLTTLLTATTVPDRGRQGAPGLRGALDDHGHPAGQGRHRPVPQSATAAAPSPSTYGADRLRRSCARSCIVGPFFGAGTTSTYTLTLDQYGQPVTIAKP